MNRTERFYKIDQLLHEQRVVSTARFLTELEVSRATLKRDLEYMRDRLLAPIVWDRESGGYRFAPQAEGPAYALPGLWFSAGELYALLGSQQLLSNLEPGLLAPHMAPLQARLAAILEAGGHPANAVTRRIRLLTQAKRHLEPACFASVAQALLSYRQLEISSWHRGRNEINQRTVSPQRLLHYRDNWYLLAWCHWRQGLRSFAVDALQSAKILSQHAEEISDNELDRHCAAAYGIFSGEARQMAILRFTPERARWVAQEQWHLAQSGEFLADGAYRLSVPYADERELLMDILRHGRHVLVEAPEVLREQLAAEISAMANQY
jgi:predicted DNA-binding transcriptional regulator YafY